MIYVRIVTDFLFFFFSLFIISSTFSIAVSQLTLGISLLLYLIINFLKKDFHIHPEMKLFYSCVAFYIGWLVISSIFNETPLKSLIYIKEEWLFFIIPIGTSLMIKEKVRIRLLSIFATIVIIVSLYGVYQFFTGASWFLKEESNLAPLFGYRISGFFSYGVTFGNLMSMVGIFFTSYAFFAFSELSSKKFMLLISSGILAITMAILTFSRAPILSIVIVSVLIFIFLGKRWWKQGILFITILLIILSFLPGVKDRFTNEFDKEYSGTHQAGRVYIWNNSFQIIADNPVFGVGLGNFKESYATYIPSDSEEIRKVSTAHNDFINIAANTGIPGFLFYLILWIAVLYQFARNFKNNRQLNQNQKAILIAVIFGSICFAIVSLFHGVFVDDEVRQVLMFLWAIGFAVILQSSKQSKNLSNKTVQN